MIKIDMNNGLLTVPKDFFESKCIVETSSMFTYKWSFMYDVNENEITIHIMNKNGVLEETDLKEYANALIDHQTWHELNYKFGHLRDMIVEQAFLPLRNV